MRQEKPFSSLNIVSVKQDRAICNKVEDIATICLPNSESEYPLVDVLHPLETIAAANRSQLRWEARYALWASKLARGS